MDRLFTKNDVKLANDVKLVKGTTVKFVAGQFTSRLEYYDRKVMQDTDIPAGTNLEDLERIIALVTEPVIPDLELSVFNIFKEITVRQSNQYGKQS